MTKEMVAAKTDNTPDGFLTRRVCVVNELGLHARPAARLAQEAQRFDADLRIVVNGQEVDAKSILDILTLSAAQGVRLELRARGGDAAEALDALEAMFAAKFDEA